MYLTILTRLHTSILLLEGQAVAALEPPIQMMLPLPTETHCLGSPMAFLLSNLTFLSSVLPLHIRYKTLCCTYIKSPYIKINIVPNT
jgi:hypothetical protein